MLYSQFKTDLKKKLQRHCAEANLSVSADFKFIRWTENKQSEGGVKNIDFLKKFDTASSKYKQSKLQEYCIDIFIIQERYLHFSCCCLIKLQYAKLEHVFLTKRSILNVYSRDHFPFLENILLSTYFHST